MRTLRSPELLKGLVVFLLSAYLLGAFLNMFFIPRYNSANIKSAVNSLNTRKLVKSLSYQTANFLTLIDKSMMDNDQVDAKGFAPKCLLLIFLGIGLCKINFSHILFTPVILSNQRYSYIAFCTFRI